MRGLQSGAHAEPNAQHSSGVVRAGRGVSERPSNASFGRSVARKITSQVSENPEITQTNLEIARSARFFSGLLGQVVGVSFPSTHAFLYENGEMTDLNSLVPSGSPLLLLFAGGINNRGEITGQACVIADGGCPAGNGTPAFLAIPKHDQDGGDSWSATGVPDLHVTVSDTIREHVMRRVAFGHSGPQPVSPQ